MKIVTGYRGEPHITSQDHQSFYQGVFGRQMYVLGTGNEFEAQLTDTNTITVSDGDGIMQGCHFRIDLGEEENIVMQPGSSGMYRNDLLVARYTKDAATGVEDVSLVTITGTPSEGTPSVPSYNTGEIVNGETVDFPLYRVHFSGFTIDDIVPLFFIMPSLEAVYQSHEALADIVDGLLSWKFAASSTGSNTVQMPLASVHEIGVVTKLTMASNNSPVYLSKVIPDAFIDRDGTYSHFATRWGTAFDGDVVWVAYKQNGRTYIRLNNAYNGKTNVLGNCTSWFYYR